MADISTSSFKTITLGPGDCFVLPKDAVVESIIQNGAITVTSNCGNLPTPTSYKCGVFYLFIDNTGEDDTAMEEEYVTYTQIKIGGTIYLLNELVSGTSEADLNTHVTDQALFQFKAVQINVSTGDRRRYGVYFQVPEDLFEDTVLQISDRGTLYNLPPNEATCGEYPIPE